MELSVILSEIFRFSQCDIFRLNKPLTVRVFHLVSYKEVRVIDYLFNRKSRLPNMLNASAVTLASTHSP